MSNLPIQRTIASRLLVGITAGKIELTLSNYTKCLIEQCLLVFQSAKKYLSKWNKEPIYNLK